LGGGSAKGLLQLTDLAISKSRLGDLVFPAVYIVGKLAVLPSTPCQSYRNGSKAKSDEESQHTDNQIADACVSPRDPHLHQFDSCREQKEAKALNQVPVRISKPEGQTGEQKDGEMFDGIGKIRDRSVVGGNDRETHNAAEQEPSRNLESVSPCQRCSAQWRGQPTTPRSQHSNGNSFPVPMLV